MNVRGFLLYRRCEQSMEGVLAHGASVYSVRRAGEIYLASPAARHGRRGRISAGHRCLGLDIGAVPVEVMVSMRLYLETIDPAVIAPLMRWGAFAGVAVEATRSGHVEAPVAALVEIQPGDVYLAFDAGDAEALEEQVRRLDRAHPSRITAMLPMSASGLEVMNRLRDERIWTAAARVRTVGHALLATNAGADVLMVDVDRASDHTVTSDAVELCRRLGGRPRVVATGMRDIDDVVGAARRGVWAVALSPELARGLLEPAGHGSASTG